MNGPYRSCGELSDQAPVGARSKSTPGPFGWQSSHTIDFAARTAVLKGMRGCKVGVEPAISNQALAERLAWPRDMLVAHAAVLAERGMPIAHIYAAAAAASVQRSILAIAGAEQQEGWPAGGLDDFQARNLADWL